MAILSEHVQSCLDDLRPPRERVMPEMEDHAEGPLDMLFLDATRVEYRDYLELAEPKLSARALLVVDNLLMSGEVAGGAPGRWPEETVEAGRAFNEALLRSEKWRGVVLPVGDGVGLATRT